MNFVTLVGRITQVKTIQIGTHKETIVTVNVQRSYKNADGEYESDDIKCLIWEPISERIFEYKKGDVIGIKGRLENRDNEIIPLAERVTFLSSGKKEGEENDRKETNES